MFVPPTTEHMYHIYFALMTVHNTSILLKIFKTLE